MFAGNISDAGAKVSDRFACVVQAIRSLGGLHQETVCWGMKLFVEDSRKKLSEFRLTSVFSFKIHTEVEDLFSEKLFCFVVAILEFKPGDKSCDRKDSEN